MRALLTIVIFLTVSGIAAAYTPEEITAESKKANDFFEKCWQETLSRHPVDESFYGIKTHYDQLEDLSDDKAAADEGVWERQLADLKKNIKFEALDAQTQLSYKLFEREAAREAEEFKYRFDIYPVSQMRGVHAQMPTFMINIHKIDDVKDADAYIARLSGFPKLFDQLLVNLKVREEKGVVAPRFVFPLVLDACHKIIKGRPFDSGPNDSPLLEDFRKKVTALSKADSAKRDRLVADAIKALNESVKPAYEKLIAFLEEQAKRATEIVQNLMYFSRPTAPGKSLVSLAELVERTLHLQAYSLRKNNVTVDFLRVEGLPQILADPHQIMQVFLNLILNAEQAIREARDKGTLRIRLGKTDGSIWASFEDDGPGIAPDILPNIFDPFYTTKRPGRGTGLGLSICKAVLKEHGGNVEAATAPAGGAIFTVYLPAASAV